MQIHFSHAPVVLRILQNMHNILFHCTLLCYLIGKYQDARSVLETALAALGIDLFSGLVPDVVSSAFNANADPTAKAALSPVAFRLEPSDDSAVSRDPTTAHAPAYLLHSDSEDSDGSSMSSGVRQCLWLCCLSLCVCMFAHVNVCVLVCCCVFECACMRNCLTRTPYSIANSALVPPTPLRLC